MNHKYLILSVVALFIVGSCSDDYMLFSDKNRIQFKSNLDENFSFVYSDSNRKTDTTVVDIMTIGEIVNYDRKVKFEQITKEWKHIYDETNPSLVVDSIYTDMAFPAVAGVHYEPIGQNGMITIPAGSNELRLKIVVLKDQSLNSNIYKLKLAILPSSDFDLGEPKKISKTINITNVLIRPTKWKDNSYNYQVTVGNWSERKHRFMIEVTGQKWDNDFLTYIIRNYDTYALRDYYLNKIKRALAEYNANPANNPPMLDENKKEVVFP